MELTCQYVKSANSKRNLEGRNIVLCVAVGKEAQSVKVMRTTGIFQKKVRTKQKTGGDS